MQVFWKLYSYCSSSEGGTLYQLRNAINRRNVVNDPKKNMNACEEFFLNVSDAHILTAAMTEFEMSTVDESPKKLLPLMSLNSLQRRESLLSEAKHIVDKYVDISFGSFTRQGNHDTSELKDDYVLNYGSNVLYMICF